LSLFIYQVPPSAIIVRIDKRLLVSLYRYTYSDEDGSACEIAGHNSPALLLEEGDPGYKEFSTMADELIENYTKTGNATRWTPDIARAERRRGVSPRKYMAQHPLSRDQDGHVIIHAEPSDVLVFPRSDWAYEAIESYLSASVAHSTRSATLIQHSGTFSRDLIQKLESFKIPTTVYLQASTTVFKTLGDVGVRTHFDPMYKNVRGHRSRTSRVTYHYCKPITSLSAVSVDQAADDSFLFVSYYVFWTYLAYQEAFDRGLLDTQQLMERLDRDVAANIDKIWGHNQPGVILFSTDSRGRPDPGYQLLKTWFDRHIEHLKLEVELYDPENPKENT
jgi:hypothetical protein